MMRVLAFGTLFLLLFGGCKTLRTTLLQNKSIKNLLGHEISIDSIDFYLEMTMKSLKVPGLSMAIINDGHLVYHTVKGLADSELKLEVSDKTIFEAASLSKPLFAFFVMTFVEEGILDLDTPLFHYFPYPDIKHDERYRKITARMVLSHITGFPNWRNPPDTNKLSIDFDPGSHFQYSGEGYQYLAKVIAKIRNVEVSDLEVLYQQRIADPLGLEVTKYVQDPWNIKQKAAPHDRGIRILGEKIGHEFNAAYSLHSEAKDFSKWMIAVLDNKLLSKASYNELFSDQIQIDEDSPQYKGGVTNYTLGFAKASLPFGTVYAHGGNNIGYSSLFAMNLDKKWGLVIFTNADQSELPLQTLMYLNGG